MALNEIHGLACIGMNASMQFRSMDALKYFHSRKNETFKRALSLPNVNKLKPGNLKDHTKILKIFTQKSILLRYGVAVLELCYRIALH